MTRCATFVLTVLLFAALAQPAAGQCDPTVFNTVDTPGAALDVAVSGAIRDALGHDVKEKDLEPPLSVKKLADFMSGSAEESISVY